MTDPITSDNFHLSRPTPSRLLSADDGTPLSVLSCSDPKILEFLQAAIASSTRRAYQSDLRHFLAHGGTIPGTAEQVARYLVDHAATLSMATLARRLVSIRVTHLGRGFPDPTRSELVRLTFRGIRRKHGQPQRRVTALTRRDLCAIILSLGQSAKDIRDAAILLIGFAGAFRRSELAAMDYQQIEIGEQGALIQIPRSKTDQEGHGRTIRIARKPGALCPIAALQAWLLKAGITDGPVFRPLMKNGELGEGRISPAVIASIVKQHVGRIGRDPSSYSGHSLRAGFATEAARVGMPKWRIKAQTGHLSDPALERYIRDGELSSGSWQSFLLPDEEIPTMLTLPHAAMAVIPLTTKTSKFRLVREAQIKCCAVVPRWFLKTRLHIRPQSRA